MSGTDDLRQGPTPFDRFLYATLGPDAQGNGVSVLSALARLQVDPWDEAADLSDLPRDGACRRLAGLIGRPDVSPIAEPVDAGTIARLIDLLPTGGRRRTTPAPAGPGLRLPKMPVGMIVVAVALLLILYQLSGLGTTLVGP